MYKLFGSVIALSVLFSGLVAARADDKSDIAGLYPKLAALVMKKDVDGVLKMGTPDFKMKQNGQTMDAKALRTVLKQQMGAATIKSCSMKPTSIKVSGNKAVVLSDGSTVMVMKTPDGKSHTMASTEKSKDTLIKTKAGWKFQMVEALSEKDTMDGKPFNPAAMGAGGPPGGKHK